MVDEVSVSLRLWDTFGDHHKDRRFAYGRSVTQFLNCQAISVFGLMCLYYAVINVVMFQLYYNMSRDKITSQTALL